jgi:hypothetical protein
MTTPSCMQAAQVSINRSPHDRPVPYKQRGCSNCIKFRALCYGTSGDRLVCDRFVPARKHAASGNALLDKQIGQIADDSRRLLETQLMFISRKMHGASGKDFRIRRCQPVAISRLAFGVV